MMDDIKETLWSVRISFAEIITGINTDSLSKEGLEDCSGIASYKQTHKSACML